MTGFIVVIDTRGAPIPSDVAEAFVGGFSSPRVDRPGLAAGNERRSSIMLFTETPAGVSARSSFATVNNVVWAASDTRLDDRIDLVRRLKDAGRDVSEDETDVRLVLHAYHVWGRAAPEHLIGDFAFVIWDGSERRLIAARDHFGVRPLFHARFGDQIVVSNRLTAIRSHPLSSDRLADAPMLDWLAHRNHIDSSATVFEAIHRVPPAHYLEIGFGEPSHVRRYWSIPRESPLKYTRSIDYVDHFIDLLDSAVNDRLRGRRAVISLSGGLDSTTVAASMVHVSSDSIAPLAQTNVYERLIPDEEGHWAAIAARSLGIHHTIYPVDQVDDFAEVDGPSWRRPEPIADTMWPVLRDQRQAAIRAGATVSLTGYGGDVIAHPEPGHLISLLAEGKVGAALSVGMTTWRYLGHRPPLYFRSAMQTWWRSKTERDSASSVGQGAPSWLNPELIAEHKLRERWISLLESGDPPHPLRPAMAAEIVHPMWAHYLESDDPSWTGIPLEQSHPFFDLRLVNFALRLPPLPWCADKLILRRAGRGRLPDAILKRPKTPLQGNPRPPAAPWLLNDPLPSAELSRFLHPDYAKRPMVRDGLCVAPRAVIAMDAWLRFGRGGGT